MAPRVVKPPRRRTYSLPTTAHFRDNDVHANWHRAQAAFARGQRQQPHSQSATKYKWVPRHYVAGMEVLWRGQSFRGHEFPSRRHAIQTALDANLPVVAVTTGSSITSETVSFTGTINHASLIVTSVSSGRLEVGAKISGPGIEARQRDHFASDRNAWRRWNLHSLLKLRDCSIGSDDSVLWVAHCRRRDVRHGRSRGAGDRRRSSSRTRRSSAM